MPTLANIGWEDRSLETSGTSVHVQDIGAINYASVTQDIDELKDAMAAVSGCVVRKASFTKDFPESFDSVPDTAGDREAKWLVRMRDTTQFLGAGNTVANPGFGKVFTFTIPGALKETDQGEEVYLPTRLLNSDVADIVGNPEMAALVTSIEANARSPWNHTGANGTPTQEVIEILYVGRNN